MAQLIHGTTINGHIAIHAGNMSDHSIATTTYVGQQITNLINGAPGALDTLNELAAALGNNASFATSVTNGLAGKLSLSGGTLTGKVLFPSDVSNRPQVPGGVLGLDTGDGNFDIWGISRDYYPSHATASNAWGLRWNGDNNDFEFVGGGSNRVILDMDGGNLTASGVIYASGGNSGNWNTAYGWGNHAGLYATSGHTHDDRYYTESESDSRFVNASGDSMSGSLTMGAGAAYVGTHGDWTGEQNKIQWHSNHLYLQNTGGGNFFFRRADGTNLFNLDNNGSLIISGDFYPNSQGTYRLYVANSGLWTNGNFGASGDLYLGTRGTWLSSWLNQSVQTGASPTFANLTTNGYVGNSSSQTRDKLRVWSSDQYSIGMKNGYDYGHLGNDEYAMSFQMNDNSGRGFWWGDTGHNDDQGAASLTTDGRMVIAKSLSIGEGESTVTPSSAPLYVKGSTDGAEVLAVDGVNGRLFTVTDSVLDTIYSVNTIAGLPIIEVLANSTVKIGKYGSNSITISDSKIAINSDSVDAKFPFYVGDRSTSSSRYNLTNPGMGFNLADGYAQLQLYGTSGAYIDFVNSATDYQGRIMWNGSAFSIIGNMSWGGATLSGAVWNGTAISDSYISSASNWNTAYNKRPTGVAFSGSSTKTLTLTLGDGSTLTAAFNDIDTDTNSDGQTLSINGSTLTISGGNSVTIPSGGMSQATADGRYTRNLGYQVNVGNLNDLDGQYTVNLDGYGPINDYGGPDTAYNASLWGIGNRTRGAQIYIPYAYDNLYFRRGAGDWSGWFRALNTSADPYPSNMNQYVRTSDAVTFTNVYNYGWFRNYNTNEGVYNQATGTHFYSHGGSGWTVTGSGGSIELQFRSNHMSTLRGYVYADTGNNIGFLNNSGSWSLRTLSDRSTMLYGNLTVGQDVGNSSIFMYDSDEGTREIHCNSNRIGFLNQSGSWGSWCDDSGNWVTGAGMYAAAFYDNDNTAFYLDPAGSSRIRNLYVGDSGSNWSDPGGWGTQVWFSNAPHTRFVVEARTPGIQAGIYVHTPGEVYFGSYTSHNVSLMYGGSRRMFITSGYVYSDVYMEAAGSMRAPIFYDSNNTGYYLDPNSTSNLYFIQMPHLGNGSPNLRVNDGGAENWNAINIGGSTQFGIGFSNSSRSWSGRNSLAMHVGASESFRVHSDGWDSLFEVWGSSGYVRTKGSLEVGGDIYLGTRGSWMTTLLDGKSGTGHLHDDRYFFNRGFGSGYPSQDANTMSENSAGFTYSNNAPLTGCLAYFPASGYGIQLNGNYNGDAFSMRSRNGDAGSWRPWKRLITDYNFTDYTINKNNWDGNLYLHTDGRIYGTIFYDSNDSAYFVDPNGTSNLYKFGEGTLNRNSLNSRQINSPWATRANQGTLYQTGAMGWGNTNLNTVGSSWGSGFIDVWGSPANGPGASGHYVGMQAFHYNNSDDARFHGWQMVCAQEANNRWFWRSAWDTPRSWVEMIHSGNIGSQTVSRADGALKLWAESHPTDYYVRANWTGSYWQLTSNHPSGVQVAYADSAGSAPANGGTSSNTNSISNVLGNSHTWTNTNYFQSNLGATSGSLSSPPLQAYCTGGNSAFMSFHRGGNYAVNFGLDSDNVLRMGGWSAAANRWQLDMSGNMTVAGDVTAFSDARVKTNVQTIENALDKTLALRGVSYNRTDSDDTRTKIGVIAQETLEVVPEVVNQDNSGMYNVSYGNMTALLIEAIKEQQAQIEDLKAEVKKLRGE